MRGGGCVYSTCATYKTGKNIWSGTSCILYALLYVLFGVPGAWHGWCARAHPLAPPCAPPDPRTHFPHTRRPSLAPALRLRRARALIPPSSRPEASPGGAALLPAPRWPRNADARSFRACACQRYMRAYNGFKDDSSSALVVFMLFFSFHIAFSFVVAFGFPGYSGAGLLAMMTVFDWRGATYWPGGVHGAAGGR